MKNKFSKSAHFSVSPRIKKINRIFLLIIATLIIAEILLPETGALVLLDEFCSVAILWAAIIWGTVLIIVLGKPFAAKTTSNKKDTLIILLIIALVVFAAFLMSRNFALDLIHGEQTIMLNRCSAEISHSSKGIIGLRYYLEGYDESGEKHRFTITGKDYDRLVDQHGKWSIEKWTSIVHGYPYTDRVVSIH